MSWPKNYRNFEFDSGKREERMSETETYPKAEIIRKPNLFEYWMLPSVDGTHDMIMMTNIMVESCFAKKL